jgi:WD40 repeat protein
VLGYHEHCPEDDYSPGVLNLYNAHSRRLIAQLHPDTAIVRALARSVSYPQRQALVISYMHVIWSPNGHRIACTFNTLSVQPPVNGVVLMDTNGEHAQVLIQPEYTSAPFYAEWDLARSQSIPFTSIQSNSSFMPLPLALAYHWGSNGTLVPETLFTHTGVSSIPQLAPIGNPDGDPSFTIWQPGAVYVTAAADSSHLFFWSASFAAWSLDERYLVDGIAPFGLLWSPAGRLFPSSQVFAFAKENHVPLLPIRDRALLQVVEEATTLAWSPNGRELAVLSSEESVDLYDCTNGRKLASRVLESKNIAALTGGASVLRWSPDGTHLLFSNTLWDLVGSFSLEQ